MTAGIPLRPLGATGVMVSALGLGGYPLGKIASERGAIRIVHAAIDAGITSWTAQESPGMASRRPS